MPATVTQPTLLSLSPRLEASQPGPTTLTHAQRERRCSLATAFDAGSIAFTHLPKAGGGSFQQLLIGAAKTTHKRVFNPYCYAYEASGWPCHSPWPTGAPPGDASPAAATRKVGVERALRDAAAVADVLVGHGSADYFEHYLRWRPNATMATMFRLPSDRLASDFRWQSGRGREYAEALLKRGGANALHAAFDEYLSNHTADARAVQQHRSRQGCRVASSIGAYEFCEEALSSSARELNEAMRLIEQRFAIVGVLERPEETLEVVRCRLPWAAASAAALPHVAATAQTWAYPVTLKLESAAMRRATALEDRLYALANELLSADVECCRKGWR